LSSTEFKRLREEELPKVLKRKSLHIALSLLLLLPMAPPVLELVRDLGGDPRQFPLVVYAILALGAALINSLQIRVPHYREKMMAMFRDVRKRVVNYLRMVIPRATGFARQLEEIDRALDRFEENFNKFVSDLEREYEKRYGYVAITFALLSIALSYALFGRYTAYGIVALAVVDGISAIVTKVLPKPRLYKHSLWSVVVTYLAFASTLIAVGVEAWKAMVVALAALIAENLGVEDNLTLPIVTTAVAYALSLPAPAI